MEDGRHMIKAWMKRFLQVMSERWKIPTHHHTVPDSAEREKKNTGVEKSRIPDLTLWIAAFSSNKSRQVIKQIWHLIIITLQVCCPVQVFIMVKKKEMTMAHNSFRRSVVTIREVYLLYPISVYATTC